MSIKGRYLAYAWGDAPTALERTLEVISHGLSPERPPVYKLTYTNRAPVDAFGGGIRVTGSIEGIADYINTAVFIESLCNHDVTPTALKYTKDTTEYIAGYKYEYKPQDSILANLLYLQIGYGQAEALVCKGCAVNRFEFAATGGEPATFTADILAKEALLDDTPLTQPTIDTTEPMMFYTGKVTFTDEAGVAKELADIRAFRLSIANNYIDDYFTIGSQTLAGILQQELEITGELELTFKNFDLYKKFIGGLKFSQHPVKYGIKLEFEGGIIDVGGGGASTYKFLCSFNMPVVIFSEAEVGIERTEVAVHRYAFRALYDAGKAASPITITIQNEESSI